MSDEPNSVEWSLEQLEKLEDDLPKIRIASSVAGAVRTRDHKIKKGDIKPKKIHVVDRNDPSWTSTKSIPDNEFTKKVLERAGIEFSVNEGERPIESICTSCAKLYILPPKWSSAYRICPSCRKTKCSAHGCNNFLSKKALTPSKIRMRRGHPKCDSCARKSVMNKMKDMVGFVSGELTVIDSAGMDKHGNYTWNCHCSCGNKKKVLGGSLRKGTSKTCGNRKNHPKLKKDK